MIDYDPVVTFKQLFFRIYQTNKQAMVKNLCSENMLLVFYTISLSKWNNHFKNGIITLKME